jgi:cytochrome oxidase assembly protein ShyY1
MRPVKVRGVYDHKKEFRIPSKQHGENGYEIIVPFYTHMNSQEEACGVLVNKGWVPKDLINSHMHGDGQKVAEITGVLYRGDNKTKYTKSSSPIYNDITSVQPSELAVMTQMPNRSEATEFMVREIELHEDERVILPNKASFKDLTSFRLPVDRHQAYSAFWHYLTLFGVAGNTLVWLYF